MNAGTDSPSCVFEQASDGTYSVRGLEVFRAGSYGEKGTFAERDLESIARLYDPANTHEAPVTTDHKQDGPAFGWVSGLKRVGRSLFADLRKISPEFYEAIKSGNYLKRSIELWRDREDVAGGKPYFKALTFLGAAAPHIKGMTDPAFKDATDPGIFFSWDECAGCNLPYVAAPYTSPAELNATATKALVITRQVATSDIRSHRHVADLTDSGDGFTSPPCASGPSTPGDGHQHVILRGVIQPKEDAEGITHTHTLEIEYPALEPAANEMENTAMSDTPNTNTVDPVAFADLKAESERNAEALKTAQAQLAQFADNEAGRKFDDAVNAANDPKHGVRITPALKAKLKPIFQALRGVAEPICFGESDVKPAADQFLACFSDFPIIGATDPNKNLDERSAALARKGEGAGALSFRDERDRRSKERIAKVKAEGGEPDIRAIFSDVTTELAAEGFSDSPVAQ